MDVFSDQERDCGEYSTSVVGRTLNGVPGAIADLWVECNHDPDAAANTIHIRWEAPKKPNGVIDHYKIEVKASATYINEEGQRQVDTHEDKLNVTSSVTNYTYHHALPNTNYTIKVCGSVSSLG